MALLVAGSACSKKDSPTAPTQGAAITLSGNMNFGNVTVGSTFASTLTIANSGASPLTVTSVTYPTGFSGNFASGTIAAGGSQAVTVTFAPTVAQAYSGNITVAGNQASGTNTIAVSGTALGPQTFTLSGVVTESAPTTSTVLAGARVTIIDGANQGKTATTGADGRYSIAGVSPGGYTVTAVISGYRDGVLPVGINGNTTLDFRLDPLAPRTSFGPGQYRVGTDIPAGRYYSDPSDGCHYQRVRSFGGASADVITENFVQFDAAQWIVDLSSTDAGFVTDANCNKWFTTAREGLKVTITPGMWTVGAQITPGSYRTESSAPGCYWQRLSNFGGATEAIIANNLTNSAGPQIVTIAATDAGFSSNVECGTWTRTP
jgi:hypothetical protein